MESRRLMMKRIAELFKDRNQTVEAILEGTEELYGTIPLIFKETSNRPEVFIPSTIAEFFILRAPKSLNAKTAELIAVASAAALRSEDCMNIHIRAALNAGATLEEVFDTIMISGLMAQTSRLGTALRVYKKYKDDEHK
jgi:AhpD family alkylhydroperoxidase